MQHMPHSPFIITVLMLWGMTGLWTQSAKAQPAPTTTRLAQSSLRTSLPTQRLGLQEIQRVLDSANDIIPELRLGQVWRVTRNTTTNPPIKSPISAPLFLATLDYQNKPIMQVLVNKQGRLLPMAPMLARLVRPRSFRHMRQFDKPNRLDKPDKPDRHTQFPRRLPFKQPWDTLNIRPTKLNPQQLGRIQKQIRLLQATGSIQVTPAHYRLHLVYKRQIVTSLQLERQSLRPSKSSIFWHHRQQNEQQGKQQPNLHKNDQPHK